MSVNKYTTASGLQTLANGSRCWIGTKAAYDAAKQAGTLPSNCLIAITDDSEDNNYSTEEKLTGKFWIDGKPIYRKVLLCTSQVTIPGAGSNWAVVPGWNTVGIDVETVIYWGAPTIGTGKNLYYQLGSIGFNGYWACISNATTIPVGAPLIVEYTKTTD